MSINKDDSMFKLFVHVMPNGNTISLVGKSTDSLKSIHDSIESLTEIPVLEQRLIYQGKRLQWEQSLAQCSIKNNSVLQLLVRRLETTDLSLMASQVVYELRSLIFGLYKGDVKIPSKLVNSKLIGFLTIVEDFYNNNNDKDFAAAAVKYLQLFLSSDAPRALVKLYSSPRAGNRSYANEFLTKLIYVSCRPMPIPLRVIYALIWLEILKSFDGGVQPYYYVYFKCMHAFGSILQLVPITWDSSKEEDNNNKYFLSSEDKCGIFFEDILPFFQDIAKELSNFLSQSTYVFSMYEFQFYSFEIFKRIWESLQPLITQQMGVGQLIVLGDDEDRLKGRHYKEFRMIYDVFIDLLESIGAYHERVEQRLNVNSGEELDHYFNMFMCGSFCVLGVLNSISKHYKGASQFFYRQLKHRKVTLNLILQTYKPHYPITWILWIFEHKDVIYFHTRKYLAMMMFPRQNRIQNCQESRTIFIERSMLLEESFNFISNCNVFDCELNIEFKNEAAKGAGVVREWFVLVCRAIFNPSSTNHDLFVACPSDLRRFYLNPAKVVVESSHLEFYKFVGRVIGLALKHNVQVGITFDRVFFNLLAGRPISVEDIQDANPSLYNSCKKIIEMNVNEVDSDVLGLTFVHEFVEEGSRKVVELCLGGHDVVVNSKNRKEYLHLLIQHVFVTQLAQQVAQFSNGLADILDIHYNTQMFFGLLELDILDEMLMGYIKAISVEDWEKNTIYNIYKETDPQIIWFWKILREMMPEQRRHLLFFWTSVMYLPVDGFGGLNFKLCIDRAFKNEDHHFPSSQTCFHKLSLPQYSSMDIMKDRLHMIAQEHISSSFGTL